MILLAGCFLCVCMCTAQLCFGLLMCCLFLGLPLRPSRLLTRQLCGSGRVCRPEFSIIRLKNNSISSKPDESFVYIGGRVLISYASRFRKVSAFSMRRECFSSFSDLADLTTVCLERFWRHLNIFGNVSEQLRSISKTFEPFGNDLTSRSCSSFQRL